MKTIYDIEPSSLLRGSPERGQHSDLHFFRLHHGFGCFVCITGPGRRSLQCLVGAEQGEGPLGEQGVSRDPPHPGGSPKTGNDLPVLAGLVGRSVSKIPVIVANLTHWYCG